MIDPVWNLGIGVAAITIAIAARNVSPGWRWFLSTSWPFALAIILVMFADYALERLKGGGDATD